MCEDAHFSVGFRPRAGALKKAQSRTTSTNPYGRIHPEPGELRRCGMGCLPLPWAKPKVATSSRMRASLAGAPVVDARGMPQ